MMYYEVDCKVEKKPEANCPPFNRVTLSFDHVPHYYEVVRELNECYPRLNLIGILRCWDATAKAEELSAYYSKGNFHGD